jgi:phosphate-selective porin OprO/OprP
MEETNRRLVDQLERTSRLHDAQIRVLLDRVERLSGSTAGEGGAPDPAGSDAPADRPGDIEAPVPDYTEGQFFPNAPAPGYPLSNASSDRRQRLKTAFGPGFQLATDDDEFRLRVHLESQLEARVWGLGGQSPSRGGVSGIYLPRQRIFFDGNITRWLEYELSINRGLGNINILNAFVNLHLDDRLQVKFGRFFTPLPYDQYAISNYWLPTPERSLFTTNLGLNRQFGLMAWGYLFDERLDYAAGVFNGSRNSFENPDGAMDFVGYLNGRPFQESEALPALRFLNLGTSVGFGRQDQSPVPVAYRIGAGSPDTNIPGQATVPFLVLNRDVTERGDRLVGSVHAAYFYKRLSLKGRGAVLRPEDVDP